MLHQEAAEKVRGRLPHELHLGSHPGERHRDVARGSAGVHAKAHRVPLFHDRCEVDEDLPNGGEQRRHRWPMSSWNACTAWAVPAASGRASSSAGGSVTAGIPSWASGARSGRRSVARRSSVGFVVAPKTNPVAAAWVMACPSAVSTYKRIGFRVSAAKDALDSRNRLAVSYRESRLPAPHG